MSYHHDHNHTVEMRAQFHSGGTVQNFAAVVGVVEQSTERPITGRSGDHLQFYLSIGGGTHYQVDVNTQSSDGSDVGLYIADQDLNACGTNPDEPFGAPAYGVFQNAQLSYKSMGLNDGDFAPLPFFRIEGQLRAALNTAHFVAVYGKTFDDGGTDGKGIHEIHYNPSQPNQDGGLLVYSVDSGTGKPKRTWFFFKFQNERLGPAVFSEDRSK